MLDMHPSGPISIGNAAHYSWGDGCDGWHLVRTGELSVIQERLPTGAAEIRHRHSRARQFFFVLTGALEIEMDGARHTVGRGEGLEIAPGVAHQVMNAGAAETQMLVISQPPSQGDRALAPLGDDIGVVHESEDFNANGAATPSSIAAAAARDTTSGETSAIKAAQASTLVTALRDGIRDAERRLSPHELQTPIISSRWLGPPDHRVSLKCENLQRTGSFKFRGALNKVLSLSPDVRARGLVAASTGNHGLALAEALRLVGGQGTIVVSAGAAPYKRQRLANAGLRVIVVDGDALEAEHHARTLAERQGMLYVSPYNDLDVVAGQGTVGCEIAEQLPDVEMVFVPVGGGGLISGVAAALEARRSSVRVIGCWAERAAAMYEAMRGGVATAFPDLPTLADANAGGIEADAITIPLCQTLVDDCVVVSEGEILRAMRAVLLEDRLLIEGAAGAAVAGYQCYVREHPEHVQRRSAIVLCGGQVGAELLADVVRGEMPTAIAT